MVNIFISDLHLEESRPDIAEIFFRFLNGEARHANALYILGDFFEVWIGDDDLTSFNQSIIKTLQKATQNGLPIYLMHGNRDFLLGKKFLRETGCQLLPDEFVVRIADKPILLMHGDTLCTEDKAYLKFRKKTRNWFVKNLFLMKSLRARKKLAQKYREGSKAHTGTTPQYIMDVTQREVENVMSKHHVHTLIHGHTHRPAIHEFQLNDQLASRIVLAPWHEEGHALIYDEKGSREFIVLK